jgi:hypothetical protein
MTMAQALLGGGPEQGQEAVLVAAVGHRVKAEGGAGSSQRGDGKTRSGVRM